MNPGSVASAHGDMRTPFTLPGPQRLWGEIRAERIAGDVRTTELPVMGTATAASPDRAAQGTTDDGNRPVWLFSCDWEGFPQPPLATGGLKAYFEAYRPHT